MAVRYARFLEILLNAALHSSRPDSPDGERPELCTTASAAAAIENGNWAYFLPSALTQDTFPADINNSISYMGDFQWWDGAFGISGIRFP
jgi:hypothetical protein